jgi:hypothetical protein
MHDQHDWCRGPEIDEGHQEAQNGVEATEALYAAPFTSSTFRRARKAEAVVDVRKDEIVKTLHFDSEAGMPQYDPVAQGLRQLAGPEHFAVIDPATDQVVGAIRLGSAREITGWHWTRSTTAFLSCEENEVMTVFDLDKNVPIAFLPLAAGPDVIKFDPGLRRIYVACYSGAISVFHQDDAYHYSKLEDFRVQHAVHTVAVDLKTHRLYTPEQEEDGKPVARMMVYEAIGEH